MGNNVLYYGQGFIQIVSREDDMKYNRIKEIEKYIMEHEAVTLDTLCEVFKVSKNTIRRDLNILTEKGSISKTYGGVVANTANNLFVSFEERNIEKRKKPSVKRQPPM
jgi:DeoR family myo-inositol catabolism operon transcriptional repressor